MKAKSLVQIFDKGLVRLRNKLGAAIAGREWDSSDWGKPIVEVKGWVSLLMRERGKVVPGSRREGFNIWTNTGREYLALRMSLDPTVVDPSLRTPYRVDAMKYIGVGTGSQLEDTNVLNLVEPVACTSGIFLAELSPVTTGSFPLRPSRTTVQYHRTFNESEITLSPGRVDITEIGLFTDGDPSTERASGLREIELATASDQAPLAYKTFEPVGKTDALELEVFWEIRF